MSGRPDHAAARLADDGVEEAGDATPEVEDRSDGTPVAADAGAGAADAGADADADGDAGAADADADGDAGAGAADAAGTDAGADAAAGTDAAAAGAGDIAFLADVAALTAQRDEYLESLQRLKAEFDNYRKRVARLQQEQSAQAESDLVAKLLPVLDNLDLAWVHLGRDDADGPSSEEARALGQARHQLLDVLAREGLERVDASAVPFDPVVHDAVAHAPAEPDGAPQEHGNGAPGTVAVDEVMRAGYRWRGQVLRPAMVRVRG